MWKNQFTTYFPDARFAVLLCFLHNLRELRIKRLTTLPLTSVMIGRLKASIVDSICGSSSSRDDPIFMPSAQALSAHPFPPGLSKLQRVIIDPAASMHESHIRHRLGDFARFASFSFLPSLQHLNGVSLISRKYNADQGLQGFSNLRSIRLINCNVAPKSFESLLSGITALESFHYTPTVERKGFQLTPVIESLRRFAGHSLTKIYLRHKQTENR